ncbi:hypothetical protein B296_00020280, partial [Ensete ventricosum]
MPELKTASTNPFESARWRPLRFTSPTSTTGFYSNHHRPYPTLILGPTEGPSSSQCG